MNYISKHFTTDGCNQLVLEQKDWTEEQFNAFKQIFGLDDVERIVISEYKLEGYAKPEISETDVLTMIGYLDLLIDKYTAMGMNGKHMLYETVLPLKRRYNSGECNRALYNAIMAVK
jgi:hypothetical protein